ncbi:unnamed protein product [Nippostrongylus brasiliensis]|uniref:PABS domain-containing protein n=1 Tax=Nippostrongylus brasiliensis TaxID=27835 RepID=A0A0N4YRF7_NIPBR|nr:unnamed protein product [Nippostrongylus brasiliensis]
MVSNVRFPIKLSITVVDINPVMKEIATKWFGMEETPHHRIVIQDGIEFVKKAAIRGLKYDAILLDLCVHVRRPMMCPIDEFLKSDAVKALNAITADHGLVMYYYTQHFRSCHLYDGNNYEQMLFCSPLERYDWRENFNERLVASNAALGNVIALPATRQKTFFSVKGKSYTDPGFRADGGTELLRDTT